MSSAMNPVVKVKTLAHFKGDLPKYQTHGSAGSDVCAAIEEPVTLKPGHRFLCPTGLILEIPTGFEIQVRPRSGLAIKFGVTLINTPGTIDSDYRGEVKVPLINLGESEYIVRPGDRIAQMVISPVMQAQFSSASELTQTARGEGGFGSTGLTSSQKS
jgi:dUTP pyrophosphatase